MILMTEKNLNKLIEDKVEYGIGYLTRRFESHLESYQREQRGLRFQVVALNKLLGGVNETQGVDHRAIANLEVHIQTHLPKLLLANQQVALRDEVLKQTVKIRRDIKDIEGGLTDLEKKFDRSQEPVCGVAQCNDVVTKTECPIPFPEMLHKSINEIGDNLWRRYSWNPERKWVCLTRPSDMNRHFTEQIIRGTGYSESTSYEVYVPTMQDLLAKDWVRA